MNEEKLVHEERQYWATVPIAIQKRVLWAVASLAGTLDLSEFASIDDVKLTITQENGEVARYHLTGEHVFTDPYEAQEAAQLLNLRNFGNYIEL